jgi:TP901 family phage tail tape measure protein
VASDAELVGLITADSSGLERAVKTSKISLFSLGDAFQSVGKIGANAGVIIAGAMVAAGGAAVAMASEFEKSMKNIQAASGKSADEMRQLAPEILRIGSNSVAGPQKVAAAFYDIVGGVADATTHMAILNAAVATSEAGQADLTSTTQGLISIMNSYKLSAKDASMVSDMLTRTVGKGVGTMDQFVAAMGPIAGLAASSGVSVKELGTAMAFMTTKGTSAAQSATQTQAALIALLKPNQSLNKLLQKVNISTTEAGASQGKFITTTAASSSQLAKMNAELAKSQAQLSRMASKGKKDALDNINIAEKQGKIAELQGKIAAGNQKVTRTAGQATKVTAEYLIKTFGLAGALQKLKEASGGSAQAMTEALGSTEAFRAFLALTGGDFADFAADFEKGMDGATEAARKVQLDSFNAQWDIFKNKLEAAAIAIGSAVLPVLNGLFTIINKLAPIVGEVASAIGGVFMQGLAQLGSSISGLFPQLLPGLESLKNKISAFFATIFEAGPSEGDAAKRAAIVKTMTKLGDITAEEGQKSMDAMAAKMKEGLGDKIMKALGIDSAMLNKAKDDLMSALKPIQDGVTGFVNNLRGADLSGVETLLKGFVVGFAASTAVLGAVGTGVLKGVGEMLPPLGTAIKSFLDMLALAGQGDITGVLTKMAIGIGSLGEALIKIPLNIAQELGKLFGIDVGKGLEAWKGNFDNLGAIITKLFGPDGTISTALRDFDLGAEVERLVNEAKTWLEGPGKAMWDTVWGQLGEGASKFMGKIGDAIVGAVKSGLREVIRIARGLVGVLGLGALAGAMDAVEAQLGKARGGSVLKGTPYTVGENGPETFVPSTSGRIIPNGGGAGGSNFKIQNLYIYGVQDPESMLRKLEQAARNKNRSLTIGGGI